MGRMGITIAALALVVGLLAIRADATTNTQVVLSATGITTSVGPGGFWLWSQPGTLDQYGIAGAGNMYFYARGIQRPVVIGNVLLSGATVTENVKSRDGAIACRFTATETSRVVNAHGVNGLVTFSCTAPAGASATSVPATVIISSF